MEQQLFDVLMVAMPLLAIVVFIALFFVKAGYGLFRTDKWGFSIDNKIAWVCMEAPVFFVMLFLWWRSSVRFPSVRIALFSAFVCIPLFDEGKEPDACGYYVDGNCV